MTAGSIGLFYATAVGGAAPNLVGVTYNGSGKAPGVKIYVDGVEEKLNVEANKLKGSIRTQTPMRIGQRSERPVEALAQSMRVLVVRPLAASHSSGRIACTVTPKVQIWPSGSRAR